MHFFSIESNKKKPQNLAKLAECSVRIFPAFQWDAAEFPALRNETFVIQVQEFQLRHCLARGLPCPLKAEQWLGPCGTRGKELQIHGKGSLPAPSATASPGSAGTGLRAVPCPLCHQSQGPNHPEGANSTLMYPLPHGGTFQVTPKASATCSMAWPRARGDGVPKALQMQCSGAEGTLAWLETWMWQRDGWGWRREAPPAGSVGGEERPQAAAVLGGNRIGFNNLHDKGL